MTGPPDRDGMTGVVDDRFAAADAARLRPAESAESAEALLERLATAVRTRVAARQAAEMRLASFAFHEPPPSDRSGRVPVAGETAVDWRYFVLRALAVMADPDVVRLLAALRDKDRTLDELTGMLEPGERDRLAAGDRVAGLASAGLVGRELESDRVALTPLGEALLDLVADLACRAGAAQP